MDRVLEVSCRFAASFLKEKVEEEEKNNDESMDRSSEDFVDLPPFMHWLIDWLLDHHEVSIRQGLGFKSINFTIVMLCIRSRVPKPVSASA